MMHFPYPRQKRAGAVAPFIALMLIPLLAMVAFGVDVGWIVLAQSDLQSAADAAALSGAGQLMDGYVRYNLPGQTQQAAILAAAINDASTAAKNYASYNSAGGVSSLTLRDADIEFGFTDAGGNYTPQAGNTGYPNTVKVTVRLDNLANNPLKLFFGSVIGTSTENLTATASATIYTGKIINFQINSQNAGVLPATLDINTWNSFLLTGQSSDGNVHANLGPYGSTSAPQLQVYPNPGQAPGNFSMLSLDGHSNDGAALRSWIQNGMAASDLRALQNSSLLPLPIRNPQLWQWIGAPNIEAADLNGLPLGAHFLLPLFEPVVGNGLAYQQVSGANGYQASNGSAGPPTVGAGVNDGQAYYNSVKLVGVTVTQLDQSLDAFVQPAAVLDPTAVFDPASIAPAGTTAQVMTTFTAPKLSR